ncbi:MAG: hypothetical protein ACYC35_05980 [Pirellulales bacterium]|jgi:hypothetical protein
MDIHALAERIGARVLTTVKPALAEVRRVYAGDRVSDLLNEASDSTLLVSNLVGEPLLRVAELMGAAGICFVNGRVPEPNLVDEADQRGTVLLSSPACLFETCGRLYQNFHAKGKNA